MNALFCRSGAHVLDSVVGRRGLIEQLLLLLVSHAVLGQNGIDIERVCACVAMSANDAIVEFVHDVGG